MLFCCCVLGKDGMCSCPPFECVCSHTVSSIGHVTNTNTTSHHARYGQALTLESKATLTQINDFTFSPQWKDSYNEFFDLGFDKSMTKPEVQTGLPYTGYEVAKSSEYCPAGSMYLPAHTVTPTKLTAGHCGALDYSSSTTCMYSSPSDMVVPGSGNSSPGSNVLIIQPNTSPDAISRGSFSDCVVPGSPRLAPILGQHNYSRQVTQINTVSTLTPSPPHNVAIKTHSEEFEVNEAGDILSLDQPVMKDCSNGGQIKREQPEARVNPISMEFSALLGLPSITSFLGEENEQTDTEASPSEKGTVKCQQVVPSQTSQTGHVSPTPSHGSDCASPHNSIGTPPSLIELKPLGGPAAICGGNETLTSLVACDRSQCVSAEKSAFLPYSDCNKDLYLQQASESHLFSPTRSTFTEAMDNMSFLGSDSNYPSYPSGSALLSPGIRNYNHNINITLSYN